MRSTRVLLVAALVVSALIPCRAGVVIFMERNFPATENGAISRRALQQACSGLHAQFVDVEGLRALSASSPGDVLVLPYGSAFPADAWESIRAFFDRGNVVVVGGRPLFSPVFRVGTSWRAEPSQNTYARTLGIDHASLVPQHGPWTIRWEEETSVFSGSTLNPRAVFAIGGWGGRTRGLGYLVDSLGNRLAAPVVAEDIVGGGRSPSRRVYLGFDAPESYWESAEGIALLSQAIRYASHGATRLWLDLQKLTLAPGEQVSGSVDVVRDSLPARLTLEILSGDRIVAGRATACSAALHEEVALRTPLTNPGLYRVRATLTRGDTILDRYTSGVMVRDTALLRRGARLRAGHDYFRLEDSPYLMVGTNYFSTDPYANFFTGGSLGGNAWQWDRDFAEMERLGLTAVRTGIWMNRARYLDVVTGAADERLLAALEAYLMAAARHHLQVIFTFFAFEPQTEMQAERGQSGNRLGPGENPYLDPVAIGAQLAYLRPIVTRFRDVPFLSYDLINEPSFSNPREIWNSNTPNGDPRELEAWQRWLEQRYMNLGTLARAWRMPPEELGAFSRVPLPSAADHELTRSGNPRAVRTIDYNLFAQEAFSRWVDTLAHEIRAAGSRQAITVGQDEGGVANRLLNHFWGGAGVDFTVNHTWWRDDGLLWNSLAAKTPRKPNLVGETGPQPAASVEGVQRWDEVQGLGLEERKLALGFACANAGVLHWDWTHAEAFGLLRRDGSQKIWLSALSGIAAFARDAQPYATESLRPEIALVLPQSLQLSVFSSWGIFAQQNATRALYQIARGTAFSVGEYQLASAPDARLYIVPSPWVLRQDAWEELLTRVRNGATLLISGRIDADEHWNSVPSRFEDLGLRPLPAALTTREVELVWPGGRSSLSFGGDGITYAERGVLPDGRTYAEVPLGRGRVIYVAFPMEMVHQLDVVGGIYRSAMERAGIRPVFTTTCQDPGILICPTVLPHATLYVLTSETAATSHVVFRDTRSGKEFTVDLPSTRASLLLVGTDGTVLASYPPR